MKISKRDILFFFIGILFVILLDTIFDLKGATDSFKKGFNATNRTTNIEKVDKHLV